MVSTESSELCDLPHKVHFYDLSLHHLLHGDNTNLADPTGVTMENAR